MQQVPADLVITELVSKLAELHRENAILKVQVDLYAEQAASSTSAHAAPVTDPNAAVSPTAP